jgi:hypothetical protein
MSIEPSKIPLAAPDAEVIDGSAPMIWNPDHTAGNTACSAMPIAATLTM